MRLTKRTLVLASLLVILLLTSTMVPALAQPAAQEGCLYGATDVWVSCANGGAGEPVDFSGYTPCSLGVRKDIKTGVVYNRTFFNRRSVPGVGDVTENAYVGSGPYESKVFAEAGPWGPAGTQAWINDVWYIESDEVLYSRTYTLRTNLLGQTTTSFTESCTIKNDD